MSLSCSECRKKQIVEPYSCLLVGKKLTPDIVYRTLDEGNQRFQFVK
jgi:hypothetical protein